MSADPDAACITIVLDNLNTHSPASLYAAFPPDEAHRILSRLDFHSTPKHASWLNMVEIELAVLVRHCLNRRIPDLDTLAHEVAAWERDRAMLTTPLSAGCSTFPMPVPSCLAYTLSYLLDGLLSTTKKESRGKITEGEQNESYPTAITEC